MPGRPDQRDRLALQQERGRAEREHPPPPVPVFQGDRVLLAPDHGTAELAGGVLDHQPALRENPPKLPSARFPRREHVRSVPPALHWHPPRPPARGNYRAFPTG